jgi:hypothetical protein
VYLLFSPGCGKRQGAVVAKMQQIHPLSSKALPEIIVVLHYLSCGEERDAAMANEDFSPATKALLRCLDLLIEASALVLETAPETAGFAMMAALTAAEKLGISDDTAYRLRDTALNELRKEQDSRD